MIAIPLVIVAASVGASIYMAFVWRPAKYLLTRGAK